MTWREWNGRDTIYFLKLTMAPWEMKKTSEVSVFPWDAFI